MPEITKWAEILRDWGMEKKDPVSKTTKNWYSLNIKNLQTVWTAYIIHAVYIMVTWISKSIIVSWRSVIM